MASKGVDAIKTAGAVAERAVAQGAVAEGAVVTVGVYMGV